MRANSSHSRRTAPRRGRGADGARPAGTGVLLIDDDQEFCSVQSRLLELAGFRVSTAANARAGVIAAIRARPDVIVCDIVMPELDGFGVLRSLRGMASTRRIPLIFLTSSTGVAEWRLARELGASGFLAKPCPISRLQAAIAACVRCPA